MITQTTDTNISNQIPNNSEWGGKSPFQNIVVLLYVCSIVFATFVSLNPWPFWSIYPIFSVITFLPILAIGCTANIMRIPIFNADNWLKPSIALGILLFWTTFVNGRNINGFIVQICDLVLYVSLFMLNRNLLSQIGDILAKLFGGWCAISLTFFILHLIGVSMPHFYVENVTYNYSYDCYRFFLIDHRFALSIIPRFHSICLEPSHLAMTCVPILLTQIGKWNKWWNIALFAATIASFSLAGYLMLIYVIFATAWLKGKAIMGKIILICSFLAIGTYAAIEYNDGDNMINNTIIQRLQIDNNGKLTGDNRVSETFDAEFKNLVQSSQIWLGRGYEKMKKYDDGNAGYKVYIFCNGLISVFLLFLFIILLAHTSPYKKVAWIFLGFHFLSFIPHATPIKLAMFVPLYIFLFNPINGTNKTHTS